MSFSSIKYYFVIIFFLSLLSSGFSQSLRSLNNDGVEQFNQKKFGDSEINFRKGIEKDSLASIPYFNLGDAYYKQKKYDEATKAYQMVLSKTKDKELKGKAFYNIGNSLLDDNKLKESIEAYKNALKMNPKDEEAKYNLSYALKKLKEEENQKKQNKKDDKQDDKNKEDQDKKDDQQNKDDKNKDKNDKQDQQNQNQNDKKDQDKQMQQQPQNQKPKMSKEQAEQILNALKDNEKNMQKKLRKKVGEQVKVEKDW
jgi:tetratricopeptide (TPR) repeat protein